MSPRSMQICGVGVLVLGFAALAASLARADDVDRMQGTWRVTHAEVGGTVAGKTALKTFEVIVQGDKFTLVEGLKRETVHIALDENAKPYPVIEFFKASGKKDKFWHGIYTFDGKEIKLCWGPAGKDRPREFATTKGNQDRYFVLRPK